MLTDFLKCLRANERAVFLMIPKFDDDFIRARAESIIDVNSPIGFDALVNVRACRAAMKQSRLLPVKCCAIASYISKKPAGRFPAARLNESWSRAGSHNVYRVLNSES